LDFFEQQEQARRTTRWLVLWYALAAVSVVASFCALAAPFRPPLQVYMAIAAIVGGCILVVSAYRIWQLSEGGEAVAQLLGARYVDPWKCSPTERRLLNVVEEMAIASGITVPPVYLLERETAINALVAGHTPHQALIIVTHGAVQQLSREELQGVMGHEFSHILNGDMALNLRLVGILAGLTCFSEQGEKLVYRAAWQAKGVPREESSPDAISALFGALVAFIGFPGSFAADAIKAAISRQREFLADAASVQFTRNPEAIAGALDSILALRAPTAVLALGSEQFSHMFFALAVSRWWSFPTHPPIEERIRRVYPRFPRDDYRATRHGIRREVAVLDDAGNVVTPREPGRQLVQHVDFAARLLAELPQPLREALRQPEGAQAVMFALAGQANSFTPYVQSLARSHMLTLADLAVPAIKAQKQQGRDRFLADLAALVVSDRRLTLRELVLLTLLRQRLREGAGQPISTQFQKVAELAADAHLVVSLVALAAGAGVQAAFEKGAAVLKLGWRSPLAAEQMTSATIGSALERLRHLAPFAKPGLLKACVETAAADGVFRIAEAELIRMVAATLDCPLPPAFAALDPKSWST
jgi:Zn-dependent protease with chaperone function